ncbi:hypothetical protein [Arenimonas sp.]|uniref:hypothetical protein n=1 Tax=Arenimonas sp. TaxID=1872635 RepID=UPI0035AE5EA3
MNPRLVSIFLVVAVIVLLVVAIEWLRTAEVPPLAETDRSEVASAGTNAASAAKGRIPAVPPFDPAKPVRTLSAPGTLDELTNAATGGDAVAACQLAAELSDCRVQHYLHGLDPANAVNRPSPRCEDLLARHGDRHLEWLRQAASAGEPEAMLRYAMGEGFGINGESFDYLRSPGFDTWRREAPGMLQALLEAGYPEAVIYRMVANEPAFGGPMANLLPADPVQDQAYSELFLLLNEDSPLVEMLRINLQSRVDEGIGAQARERAARWHQDHFGGRRFDLEALNAGQETAFPVMRAHGATCSVPVGEAGP